MAGDLGQFARHRAVDIFYHIEVGREEDVKVSLVDL
jgi:hypothetical protein